MLAIKKISRQKNLKCESIPAFTYGLSKFLSELRLLAKSNWESNIRKIKLA